MNYTFPMDSSWTTHDLIKVVECLSLVEQAYIHGIDTKKFEQAYRDFKTVVTSISQEKRVDREFQQTTGYSLYQVVKAYRQNIATNPIKPRIKMR